MLALAGDVRGREDLDAGCGAGPLMAELRDRGAHVSGFDPSTGMLAPPRGLGSGTRRDRARAADHWTETWDHTGEPVPMEFWTKPLHAMTDAFGAAGFAITRISEPLPLPEAAELFPEDHRALSASPSFLFFVLTRD